ncbi:MAG: T9SS type A sorting domain-containing protein [Bacteroidia bacterium]
MKKRLLFFCFCFYFAFSANAQWFYNQYFDGADTSYTNSIMIELDTSAANVWQIGEPQKTLFHTASSLPNVIVTDSVNFYPTNNTSQFIAKIRPMWGFVGIFALQWNQKIDIRRVDGAILEFSMDYGQTWQNVFNNPNVYNFYGFDPANKDTLTTGEYVWNGTDTTWRNVWLCFSNSWLFTSTDTAYFRFTLKSVGGSSQNEGWMIDNMSAHVTQVHTVDPKDKQEHYISVYPNPSAEILYIEAKYQPVFHLIEEMELLTYEGKVVERWQNIPTKYFINTQKYATGNYLLKVKTNLKTETIPIVVSKHE